MDRETATAGNNRARQPGRAVALLHVVAVLAGASLIWLTGSLDRWAIGPLVVLAAFATVSAVTDISTGVRKVSVSGVPIGLTTAIVVVGPGPAALIGVFTMIALWT
ncbi:MAG: hypothetical protein ACLP0L_11125, partial [Solirubrobacteraceae bacterium]